MPNRLTQLTIDVLVEHIAVIDEAGSILAVNAAWREFARSNGADPGVVSEGSNYLEVCDRSAASGDSDAATAAALIREVISGKSNMATMEYTCHAPTEQRWYKFKATRSHAEGPLHIVIEHENIGARKLAERQIRLQARLLASVEQAVIATDLHGDIIYWNPFAEQLYGWSANEVLRRNIVDVTPVQSTQGKALQILSRLKAGESWSGEFLVRHRSGRIIPIHVTDSPLRDEDNQLIGIIGISTDMTEQKKTEQALRLSAMVYQAIGEAIMVVNIDGRIAAINPAFMQLTGYTETEVVGQHADVLKPDHDSHFFPDEMQQSLGKIGYWAGSIWTRHKGGELSQEWLRIDTIYDKHGADKLHVCMFSRITDQKRAKEMIWQQANSMH